MFADSRPAPAFVVGDNAYEIDVLANQKYLPPRRGECPLSSLRSLGLGG